MSPSDATNRTTRAEWRALGFYYEIRGEPPCWRFVGSAEGLSRFVALLDEYVRDPRNEALSEHEHYGPYMYLKVQTAESPEIDGQSIRGSLRDLARLGDLIAAGLLDTGVGRSLVIGQEYSESVRLPLWFEVREAGFDPATADPLLPELPV